MHATVQRKLLAGLPGSPRLWAMLAVACLGTFAFLAVTTFVFDPARNGGAGPVAFDQPFAHYLYQMRTPALTGRIIEVSALGSAPVLAVLAVLVYSVIIRAGDRLGVAHLTVAIAGGAYLSRALQAVFDRARPDDLIPIIVVTKGSYPSAHLFGATACYLTFAFFYARYARGLATEIVAYVAASLLIVAVGLTRVYLGAHHLTDVVAGIAGGAAWAFLVAAVFTHWYEPSAARVARP